MKIEAIARHILMGEKLEEKLMQDFSLNEVQYSDFSGAEIPILPYREKKLQFKEQQAKFPKTTTFNRDEKRGEALHFFANHELLAIEMMSAIILLLPHQDLETFKIKKAILGSLQDEQKHLKLYIERMNELGVEFGDFPLSDFFWRQMEKIKNLPQYFSVMSLTFESANLDFADYYRQVFLHFEDQKTADIMQMVFDDEVSHVALGAHFLNKNRGEQSVWNYYLSSLPWPLTPARSKGINYQQDFRLKAGLSSEFVQELTQFQDDFRVTERKSKKDFK